MPAQPTDTQEGLVVAHLGKDGLDLRVDRRALGPDVLTEAVNVVYRSSSGVRTRDGHEAVPVRTPAAPLPDNAVLYSAFGTGEAVVGGDVTGRWPVVRGLVDGPNAPWAWTGDHLVSAPNGQGLDQTSPADAQRLFLPRLRELVPSSTALNQAPTGLGALSVDTSGTGYSFLWLVTPSAIEGWEVLVGGSSPDELVTRRFSLPVSTQVTQLRAICVKGVHYVFYKDTGLIQGFRWFSGEDPVPTQIYNDGLGVFDLVSYQGLAYMALANGATVTLRPLDSVVTATAYQTVAPHTVVEMAVATGPDLFVIATTDQVNGVDIYAKSSVGASWTNKPGPDYVDGLAAAVDGLNRAWVWSGRVSTLGGSPYTQLWKIDPRLFSGGEGGGSGFHWNLVNTLPNCVPCSGGFVVGEVPCVWLNLPVWDSAVTNSVAWLWVGETRHEAETVQGCVGAAGYHGYGLKPSRVVLPAPTPLDTSGYLWGFAEGAPAYKYQAGLQVTVTPPPPGVPTTAGDGPVVVLTLDFSDRAVLSQARLGAAKYLAGGQPHGFDGRMLYEAGFNGYPVVYNESVSTVSGATDSLDDGDTRQYRFYLVWRNAGGELMYSRAVIYQSKHAAVASPQALRTLTVSFSCPATELQGKAWVEAYATTGAGGVIGTNFKQIVSEGDGVYLYQNGDNFFTLVDSISDAHLTDGTHPDDPYNPGLVFPANLPAGPWPACDSVTAAGDRIWLAGGLVPPGTLSFTKLRTFGVAVEHTDDYGLMEVASDMSPVEWVAPVQDSVMAVAGGALWAWGGQGPDNTGQGSFNAAIKLAGGVSGVRRSVISGEGTWVISASGCLLIGPGLSVQDVSEAITQVLAQELAAGDCLFALYDSVNEEIRWYLNTGTVFVLDRNLPAPRWALWRLPRVVGGSETQNLLVTSDGRWLDTSPGHATDAGQPIQYAVSTSDLTPAEGSWVRFRKFLVAGKWLPANAQGKLTLTAHYDGADYDTSLHWWQGPDNTRPLDQWFGRVGTSTRDALLRQRGRFLRQRGSSVRLRFVGTGAPALLSQVTITHTQPQGVARLPMK